MFQMMTLWLCSLLSFLHVADLAPIVDDEES